MCIIDIEWFSCENSHVRTVPERVGSEVFLGNQEINALEPSTSACERDFNIKDRAGAYETSSFKIGI